jgi:hypothetical protein
MNSLLKLKTYPYTRLSIGILMATMYGYDVKSLCDPFIEVAERGQRLGNGLLVPGATLLNVIPILCRIPPIASTQKLAAQVRELTEAMQKLPMDFAKRALVSIPEIHVVTGH